MTEIISVDMGASHLLVAGIQKRKTKSLLTHFFIEPIPSSPEAISSRLTTLFAEGGLSTKSVRVAFRGQGVVIRILNFPQMKKEDFASAIRYEAEKYIPFKPDEIFLDFQILSDGIGKGDARFMKVLLVAAKQTEVYQMLKIFQNAGLNIALIDVGAFAVANFIEATVPKVRDFSLGFLDMGLESTTLGILHRGTANFIREISFGGSDIVKPLKRKLGLEADAILDLHKAPDNLTHEHREILGECLESFLTEVKLSLAYYSDNVPDAEPLQTLLVTGSGTRFLPGLGFLEKEIKIPARRPDIFGHVEIQEGLEEKLIRENEDLLSVALGLCLRT